MAALKVLGVREVSVSTDSLVDDWFTKGLIVALQRNLALSKAEEIKLRRGKVFKDYQKHVPEILKQLNTLLPKNTTQIKGSLGDLYPNISNAKTSLAYMAGQALLKWCYDSPEWYKQDNEWKMKPVTPQRVFSEAHKVIRALDNQFPGYIQANLFGLVFSAIKGDKNGKIRKRST